VPEWSWNQAGILRGSGVGNPAGSGFKPQWLQATFDPWLPKKITSDSQPKTMWLS